MMHPQAGLIYRIGMEFAASVPLGDERFALAECLLAAAERFLPEEEEA